MITNIPISMIRGDTLEFNVHTPDLETDLTGAFFTVRQSFGGQILFQKSLTSGITKQSDGVYLVRVAPADTASLTPATYVYDLELRVNPDVYTPILGSFTIEMDVTTA